MFIMNSQISINVEAAKRGMCHRIKLMRRYLGYTQEEMAEKIGVSDRQYRRYENNSSNFSLETLVRASLIDKHFTSTYLLTGYVNEDYAITAGLRKMPEAEYRKLVDEYLESDKPENVIVLLTKLAEYGENHSKDADVREYPMVDVMTRLFEENMRKVIESR